MRYTYYMKIITIVVVALVLLGGYFLFFTGPKVASVASPASQWNSYIQNCTEASSTLRMLVHKFSMEGQEVALATTTPVYNCNGTYFIY